MGKPKELIGGLSHEILFEALSTCADLADVRQEVILNHDNNRWWPTTIQDWRLRMVIAGWSTRVSYNMINTYQQVVHNVSRIGYDDLCRMSDAELQDLIGSLGLFNARNQYLRSLAKFIEEFVNGTGLLPEIPNDTLIEVFAKKVKGANYKVAQCAALYAKGYHCGIFPVDSGMKDMLGPCLGLHLPQSAIAHEIMRKQVEKMLNVRSCEYYQLAVQTGYGNLAIPKEKTPVWWAHLVLIYFKRLYCNKKNPCQCPLHTNPRIGKYIGSMCDRVAPQSGGYQYVVVEGVDQVGKTTVTEELKKMGYVVIHSPYNPNHADISLHYRTLIDTAPTPAVFDRIFISEVAYGHAIRKNSRLSDSELQNLLAFLADKNCVILYLKESQEVVQHRLLTSDGDHIRILDHLDELILEYDRCMEKAASYMPVYEVSPTTVSKENLLPYILQIVGS